LLAADRRTTNMPNLNRRGGGGGGYTQPSASVTLQSEFQVYHPYHSQGLAAGGSALLDAINRGKVHLAKFKAHLASMM